MHRSARSRRRLPALGAAGLTALLLTAGCGSSAAPANGSSTAAGASKCATGAASLQSTPAGATTLGSNSTPVQLIHGNTLAQVFTASAPFSSVGAQSPTWFTTGSGYTLVLRQGAGLTGKTVACAVFDNAADNGWNVVSLGSSTPAAVYTLEMEHPSGTAQEACPGHRTDPNCSTTPLSGKKGGVIGWWAAGSGATAGTYGLADGKQNGDVFSVFYQ